MSQSFYSGVSLYLQKVSSPDYLLARFALLKQRTCYNKQFFGTMALLYSGVPSTSRKQARAGVKTRMGQLSDISIWLAECSQFYCGSNIKNNSNLLLIVPATQANGTRHVIKCVAVIEKVYYLKNCVFLPMYINTQLIQLRLWTVHSS